MKSKFYAKKIKQFFHLQKRISYFRLVIGYCSFLALITIILSGGVFQKLSSSIIFDSLFMQGIEGLFVAILLWNSYMMLSFHAQREFTLWCLYRRIGLEKFFWANMTTYYRLYHQAKTYGELQDAINGFLWLKSSTYYNKYLTQCQLKGILTDSIDTIEKDWLANKQQCLATHTKAEIPNNAGFRQKTQQSFMLLFQIMPASLRTELTQVQHHFQ